MSEYLGYGKCPKNSDTFLSFLGLNFAVYAVVS